METEPRDRETDLGTVLEGGGRFVRDGGEHVLPSVLLSVMLSSGEGCAHNAVAECLSICVPLNEDLVTNVAQNQRGESIGIIDHSVLAEQALVSRSAGDTNGSPVADSTEMEPPVSGGQLDMAPQTQIVETSCVDGARNTVNARLRRHEPLLQDICPPLNRQCL